MITDAIKVFRSKLEKGAVIGCFSKTSDPAFIEVMGLSGMDFVIIDLEHGPNTVETAKNLIRAAQLSKVFPIVRIKEEMPEAIGHVLDIDAGGIQIPNVSSAAEAQELLKRQNLHLPAYGGYAVSSELRGIQRATGLNISKQPIRQ